jgi:hypothetical protein
MMLVSCDSMANGSTSSFRSINYLDRIQVRPCLLGHVHLMTSFPLIMSSVQAGGLSEWKKVLVVPM